MLPFRPRAASWAVLASGVLLLATPSVAHAQSPAHIPTADEDHAARAEFLAGRDAFSRGAYDEAARRFDHAYQLSGRAQLLYNVGTAYDRAHRWAEARDALQRYLAAVPNASDREEVRARLVNIEAELRHVGTSIPPDETHPIVGIVEPPRPVVPPPVPNAHPWRTTAVVVGSLGVISALIAGGVGLFTSPYYDSLVHTCGVASNTPGGCPQFAIQDIELRATLSNVFLVSALVLVVGAGSALAVDLVQSRAPARSASARLRLTPSFGPTPGGVAFGLAGTL